jgi:hypothetical protein
VTLLSFARFNILTDDDLHASLACTTTIGSPASVSVASALEGSSSGDIPVIPGNPHAGAAARSSTPDGLPQNFGEGEA